MKSCSTRIGETVSILGVMLTLAWLKRYQDDFDESDMKGGHMSTATTPTTTSVSGKGKEPEKA
jgi:hypothetical protein